MLNAKFRILFFIIFASWPGFGSTVARTNNHATVLPFGQITGNVRFSNGGVLAANVLVRLDSFGGGLVNEIRTDRTGKFTFPGLVPAQYVITAHAQGYLDDQRQIDLQTTTSEYVILTLKPERVDPPPTAITKLLDANVPAAARKEYEAGLAITQKGPDKKELAEGLQHLEQAIKLYPNFFEAYLLLGSAYMDARQWDKAEAALRQAAALNPKMGEPLFALGELYRIQKRYPDAEKSLQEGLALEGRSWQGHLSLARAYWELAEAAKDDPSRITAHEKSWKEVTQALKLRPDLAAAHLLAGNLLMRAHRAQDALTHFESYLRLEPKGEAAQQTQALVQKIKQALAGKPVGSKQ